MKAILRLLNELSDIYITTVILFESVDHLLSSNSPSVCSLHESFKHLEGRDISWETLHSNLSQYFISCLFTLQGFYFKGNKFIHGTEDILKIFRVEEVLFTFRGNLLGGHQHEFHFGNNEVKVYESTIKDLELFE